MGTQRQWVHVLGALVVGGAVLMAEWTGGVRSVGAQQSPTLPTDQSGVTQNWNKVLPAAERFVILGAFNGQAVLDKETGLVWEQSPDTNPTGWGWQNAIFECTEHATGGRRGWRLPSVHELASLMDPSVAAPPGPALPPGHPFANVQSNAYWSASTIVDGPGLAWFVSFNDGAVGVFAKNTPYRVWCVRGGNNANAY